MKPVTVIPRRPLVGLAVGFVVGTGLGLTGGDWRRVAVGWLAVAGVWLASRLIPSLCRLQVVAVLLLAGATGWLAAAAATDRRQADVARLSEATQARRVTFIGIVSGDVDARPLKRGGASYRFALRQVSLAPPGTAPVAIRVPVNVTWYGPNAAGADSSHPVPRTGERWTFSGHVGLRSGMLRKVRATLTSREPESRLLTPASLRDGRTLADKTRQATAARLARGIENWGALPTLVQAMFLGTRSDIPQDLQRVFRDSGTVHIFAISGMNVAMVAAVLIAVLALLGVPRPMWVVPLAPLLFFYTFMTGMSPSALRAYLMAVLYFGAPLLRRKADGLVTLAAAALIALAVDPFQLQDAGFGLSFAVMVGLLLLCPPLSDLFRRALRVDDAALDARAVTELGGDLTAVASRYHTMRVRLLRGTADVSAMSVAAWLSSTPLTVWYFGRLTPGSLLANLPVAPAAFLVGVSSCVGLVAGVFSPWLEAVFNHAAAGMTWLMIAAARATVAIPGGALTIPRPALWVVGCWYALLLLFAWWLWRRTRRDEPHALWLERVRDSLAAKVETKSSCGNDDPSDTPARPPALRA